MAAEHLLELESVTRLFKIGAMFKKTEIMAVDNVSLTMPADRPTILSIVGESGSGKSTLARMILRLLPPTSGRIVLNGQDVWASKKADELVEFKRTVQPIFQSPQESLNPLRPARDALWETARNLGVGRSNEELEQAVGEALESVGLDLGRVAWKYPVAFSGGELQRISIARALIPKPKLVVADEPVSMVDASLRMTIVNLFGKLRDEQGISFVYVTHDLSTAYYISDIMAVMYRGEVVEFGRSEEVLTQPQHPYTKLLLSAIPDLDEKWSDAIALSVMEREEFAANGCRFYGRCSDRMPVCANRRPQAIAVENRKVACFKFDPALDKDLENVNGQEAR